MQYDITSVERGGLPPVQTFSLIKFLNEMLRIGYQLNKRLLLNFITGHRERRNLSITKG